MRIISIGKQSWGITILFLPPLGAGGARPARFAHIRVGPAVAVQNRRVVRPELHLPSPRHEIQATNNIITDDDDRAGAPRGATRARPGYADHPGTDVLHHTAHRIYVTVRALEIEFLA